MGGLSIQSAVFIRSSLKESFAGDNLYEDYAQPDTMPSYRMATDYGGYCALEFGAITIFLDAFDFDNYWPPPRSMPFSYLFVVGDSESDASIIFEGEAYRSAYDREMTSYTLYGPSYEAYLLDTQEALDGSLVDLPRAFGAVTYRNPVQMPENPVGYPTYHKAYVTGTVGTDWHVYDDGVNIDSKVVDNGDGTFHLTIAPVGEVGISGEGPSTTLVEIFSWACGRLGLGFDYSKAESPPPSLAHWAEGNERLIDFLSNISGVFDHFFFIRNGTLYLIDNEEDYDVRPVTESDIGAVKYKDLPPMSEVLSVLETRTPVTPDDADGVYVRVDKQEIKASSIYAYGQKTDITPYHTDSAVVQSCLDTILDHYHSDRMEFSVPLDPFEPLPLPGCRYEFTDESMVRSVTVWGRVRGLSYDFVEEKVYIEAEGEVAAG